MKIASKSVTRGSGFQNIVLAVSLAKDERTCLRVCQSDLLDASLAWSTPVVLGP